MPGNRRTSARPRLSGAVELHETDVHPDPILQFGLWYDEALNANLVEPTAMTLATATRQGLPSARVVLLKGYDDRGFVFFTNYESAKGRELTENPSAALVFWWGALQRQIRVTGAVTRVSGEESDAYFETRPMGSRLGAIASKQSTVLTSRDELEDLVRELAKKHRDGNVPRPPHWGGFRITPNVIEFWQGRPDRLHDRLRYVKSGKTWKIERLSP